MQAASANRLPELRDLVIMPYMPWSLIQPVLAHCPRLEWAYMMPCEPVTDTMVRGIELASTRGVRLSAHTFSGKDVIALWKALPYTARLPFDDISIIFKEDAASLTACVESLIQAEHITGIHSPT